MGNITDQNIDIKIASKAEFISHLEKVTVMCFSEVPKLLELAAKFDMKSYELQAVDGDGSIVFSDYDIAIETIG